MDRDPAAGLRAWLRARCQPRRDGCPPAELVMAPHHAHAVTDGAQQFHFARVALRGEKMAWLRSSVWGLALNLKGRHLSSRPAGSTGPVVRPMHLRHASQRSCGAGRDRKARVPSTLSRRSTCDSGAFAAPSPVRHSRIVGLFTDLLLRTGHAFRTRPWLRLFAGAILLCAGAANLFFGAGHGGLIAFGVLLLVGGAAAIKAGRTPAPRKPTDDPPPDSPHPLGPAD
jgi:hypothetical protein